MTQSSLRLRHKIVLVRFKNEKNKTSLMVCVVRTADERSMISEIRRRYKTNGRPLRIIKEINKNIPPTREEKLMAQETLEKFELHLGEKLLHGNHDYEMEIGYLDRLLTLVFFSAKHLPDIS